MNIFVDTSVVMAAAVHRKHRVHYFRTLQELSRGHTQVLSPVILTELFHAAVASRQNKAPIPALAGDELVRGWSSRRCAPVEKADAIRALDLMKSHKGLSAYDALHLAVADRAECQVAVTKDRPWPAVIESAYRPGSTVRVIKLKEPSA